MAEPRTEPRPLSVPMAGLGGFKASPPGEGKLGLPEAHSPVTMDSCMIGMQHFPSLALDFSPRKLVATVLQGVRGLGSSSYAAGSEAVKYKKNKPSYSSTVCNDETLGASP